MTVPAASTEHRLTEALAARADLVGPADLAAAGPPAVVVPLHRRRPVVAGIAAAALVAAAAVVAVAVTDEDPTGSTGRRVQVADPNRATSPAPERSSVPAPERTGGLFEETDPGYVDPGTPVVTSEGISVVVSADSSTLTLTDQVGRSYNAPLQIAPDGSANRLSSVELGFGQAGTGWLVRYGEEYARLTVLNLRAGRLVPATVTGGVPLGDGFLEDGRGYLTWINGGALLTRVSVGSPDEGRYDVYRWELTGPGEGGGRPDSDVVDLVPAREGTFCADFAASPPTYQRC